MSDTSNGSGKRRTQRKDWPHPHADLEWRLRARFDKYKYRQPITFPAKAKSVARA